MKKVVFPEDWSVDEWYGFKRHHFTVDGCDAWIVEPEYPASDMRWTWCAQWAEAFVPRVGTVAYLQHGFYHGHVDVHKFHGSPKGMEVMAHFQDAAVALGLAEKVSLIGLSWGGFYSLRYAGTYPERVCSLYLDAPVCNASDREPSAADRICEISEQWGMTFDELRDSPLNPLNNVKPIIDAKIPVYALIGRADNVVIPATNYDLLEAEFKKLGVEPRILKDENILSELGNAEAGVLYLQNRRAYAHHPHGFDDVTPLMHFHWSVRDI